MDESCCICGIVLAPDYSDFPPWCKDIRAICWLESRPALSGQGSLDNDIRPFNLPIPSHGFSRFYHHRSRVADKIRHSCYPFHAACWTLLEEIDGETLLHDIEILFNIFDSVHYRAYALRWMHNYFFDEILDSSEERLDDIITVCKAKEDLLADPSLFNFSPEFDRKQYLTHAKLLSSRSSRSACCSSWLHLLPKDVFESIMYHLDSCDSRSLLQACGKSLYDLSSLFWKSRFWPHGETGFAQSLRPSLYSWKDWFFTIQSEIIKGPNRMNLRNRKRIWRLGTELIKLVRATKESKRVLYGNIATLPLDQMHGSVSSCLAQPYDFEGCRELKQRFVPLDNRLCAVIPSYILISNQRFISGLSFALSNSAYIDVGYVVDRKRDDVHCIDSAKFLWLVSSPEGFESITLDVYPQQFLDGSKQDRNKLAIARWKLEDLQGVCVGIDAMRIVRICIDIREQDNLDNILWTPPYPLSALSIYKDDIAALSTLQRESFAPASTYFINPKNRRLLAIKIYSPLGCYAGITGIGFVYNTGVESMWGSTNDAASLVFFLDRTEYLTKVNVYKENSLVCNLQFTTNLRRTSNPLPHLPMNPNKSLECVKYEALNGEFIVGFCGCFTGSPKELNCFGVMSTTTAVSSKSAGLPIENCAVRASQLRDMPLGGIRNHGQHQSHLRFLVKYQSVQASVNTLASKYRRAGQVTGLLFRGDDKGHPDLLGQYTGAGCSYDLEEGEHIIDLRVTTIKPLRKERSRVGLSQVEGMIVVTNRRMISWSSTTTGVCERELVGTDQRKIMEATWEFNAMFDRVKCIYE